MGTTPLVWGRRVGEGLIDQERRNAPSKDWHTNNGRD
jgi:hypothetical protein